MQKCLGDFFLNIVRYAIAELRGDGDPGIKRMSSHSGFSSLSCGRALNPWHTLQRFRWWKRFATSLRFLQIQPSWVYISSDMVVPKTGYCERGDARLAARQAICHAKGISSNRITFIISTTRVSYSQKVPPSPISINTFPPSFLVHPKQNYAPLPAKSLSVGF